MIHPDRMTQISILAPKTQMKNVITTLHALRICHIIEHHPDQHKQHHQNEHLDIATPLEEAPLLAELSIKVKSLLSHIKTLEESQTKTKKENIIQKKKSHPAYTLETRNPEGIKRRVEKINYEYNQQLGQLREAEEQLIKSAEKEKTIKIAEALQLAPEVILHKSDALALFLGFAKEIPALEKITKRYTLKQGEYEHKKIIAVFAESKKKEQIQQALAKAGYTEIQPASLEGNTPHAIKEKKAEQEKIKKALLYSLAQKGEESLPFLASAETFLDEELKKAEVPLKFAATEKTFLVKGWIPAKKISRAKTALEEAAQGKIFLEERAVKKGDKAPVALQNNKLSKPFEILLRMFSLPNYKEIDPTILLFITFPIFFGLMLGDAGYGLATMIFFMFLKRKIPAAKQLLQIMIYASLMSIFFGFLFGEYFGFEHLSEENGKLLCDSTGICLSRIMELGHEGEINVEYIYDFPRILQRAHSHVNVFGMELLSVLFIGTIIGIIHINLALLIGFYNVWKARGLSHAVYEKISWIILQAGIAIIAFGYQGIGFHPAIGGILILISAVMLFKGEGIKGIIELPSIFSNVLSYMRLGAVGLASVGLAVVVNENLALPMMQKGGIFIAIGILIFIIGHLINIALGVIGPFLHALRLHYVEFFTRFYEGGGIAYQPFGKKIRDE